MIWRLQRTIWGKRSSPSSRFKSFVTLRSFGSMARRSTTTPDNWKKVELQRYIDAFYRHWLSFIEDNNSKDAESGIEHYKHMACNMAFICELMKEKAND